MSEDEDEGALTPLSEGLSGTASPASSRSPARPAAPGAGGARDAAPSPALATVALRGGSPGVPHGAEQQCAAPEAADAPSSVAATEAAPEASAAETEGARAARERKVAFQLLLTRVRLARALPHPADFPRGFPRSVFARGR